MSEGEANSNFTITQRIKKLCECVICFKIGFPNPSYQCKNGHLICEHCKKLKSKSTATCPICQVEILNMANCIVATKIVGALPINCSRCGVETTFEDLNIHMKTKCNIKRVASELDSDVNESEKVTDEEQNKKKIAKKD